MVVVVTIKEFVTEALTATGESRAVRYGLLTQRAVLKRLPSTPSRLENFIPTGTAIPSHFHSLPIYAEENGPLACRLNLATDCHQCCSRTDVAPIHKLLH
jgi:hypothetical protein